ncbi:MAG TPA: class I SAM-dependent methyltransferase [Opitutaceae bacterium]|jgi:SAM-dependent methyltransferase|nr:class I SAM-dependent methyltransferase [Opitutaceae bacterium]
MAPSEDPKIDPLKRFSDRVGDYVKYRPSYPAPLMEFLQASAGLGPQATVADVGSGTGIFTGLLLGTGARVIAVEPNDAMREAAEYAFRDRPGFQSMKGTAEATGLADASVSLITCAQAFHWFRPDETRAEFRRILRPSALCALVWNTSVADKSDFALGYEKVKMEHGTDFKQVRHEVMPKESRADGFFGRGNWKRHVFENHQLLDLEGLKGRLLSSSYAPQKGRPGHLPMITALEDLFVRTQRDGFVRMDYVTELFLGRL